MMTHQIAVVGAGVIGCGVAVLLTERFQDAAVVTLISEEFTPNTTSDASGAIMIPFDVRKGGSQNEDDDISNAKIRKWTKDTFNYLDELYTSKDANLINIQLVQGYYADIDRGSDPWWKEFTPGFRHVETDEIDRMKLPTRFKHIYAFSTYIMSCLSYLPWMMDKFIRNGGIVKQRKVHNISELSSYDIVINCAGLGSNELFGDSSIYPVRGDAISIEAPWIKQFVFFIDKENYTYIFPRANDVLLGGTKGTNNWSKEPSEEEAESIMRRCCAVIPSISNAKRNWISAGLRPARETVRLDFEPAVNEGPPVIHCYGHGGQGVMLHWGCTLEVVEIVQKWFSEKKQPFRQKL